LSDKIGRRKPPFVAGVAICTAAIAGLVYFPGLPLPAIMVLCFICGFGGSSQTVGFAAAREHNEPALSGTAIGLVNGIVTGAGALFQPLLGWLLDLKWRGQIEAGGRIYDAEAYQLAFSAIVAMAVVGLVCVLAMKETYCRPQR
jgi:MFS family permease